MAVKHFIKLATCLLLSTISIQAKEITSHSPKADAGHNKFAQTNTIIELNASNSTDIDGDKLHYQ